MTGAAHQVALDPAVGLGADGAGFIFGRVAAAIGAGAEDLALVMPIEHGTAADHDGRQVGAGGAHQRGWRGLITIGEQDDATERIAADHLFGVHRRQVAAEHGGRAEVDFAQRDGGEFEREAARLQHAALDRFAHGAQVAVAVVELAVGVADADERAGHISRLVARGGGEGAAGEAGDALGAEEVLGAGLGHGGFAFSFFTAETQRTQREISTDWRRLRNGISRLRKGFRRALARDWGNLGLPFAFARGNKKCANISVVGGIRGYLSVLLNSLIGRRNIFCPIK